MEVPKLSGEEVQKVFGSETACEHACDVQLKKHLLNLPEFQTVLRTYASCLKIGASPEFLAAVDGFDPVAALQLKYTSADQPNNATVNQPQHTTTADQSIFESTQKPQHTTTADQQKNTSGSSREEGSNFNPAASGDSRSKPPPISKAGGAYGLGAVEVNGGLAASPEADSLAGAHNLMASLSEALAACLARMLAAHTAAETFLVDVGKGVFQDAAVNAAGGLASAAAAAAAGGVAAAFAADAAANGSAVSDDAGATVDAAGGGVVVAVSNAAVIAADAANNEIRSSSSSGSSSNDGDGAFTSSAMGSRGSGGFLEGNQEGDMFNDIMADISISLTLATHSQEHHRVGSHLKAEAASSSSPAGDWETSRNQQAFRSNQGSREGDWGMGQIHHGFDSAQGDQDADCEEESLRGLDCEEEEIESVEAVERAVRGRFGGFLRTVSAEHVAKHVKGKLPEEATGKLLRWWTEHVSWPYPTEQEKLQLMGQTGLDSRQVNNWFINQRKRHWTQHSKRQRKGV